MKNFFEKIIFLSFFTFESESNKKSNQPFQSSIKEKYKSIDKLDSFFNLPVSSDESAGVIIDV